MKTVQIRENLFNAQYLVLCQQRIANHKAMLQARANALVAVAYCESKDLVREWSAKSLLKMCVWEHAHYNNLKHVHQ
jgi:superoxide dismutase